MLTIRFKKSLWLLVAAVMPLFYACDGLVVTGSGDIITDIRDEKDFHALSISVPGKVEVYTGSEFKIEIEIEETLLPYLETEVRNGRLDIYFSRNVHDVDDLLIKITAPVIDDFEIDGSGEIVGFDTLSGAELKIDISGSGSVELKKIDFQTIRTEISGSGDTRLTGTGENLFVDISGSGDVNTLDCPVKNAEVDISGSGTLRCAVSESLKAKISGSGEIFYQGTPSVDANITGSGKVKKL